MRDSKRKQASSARPKPASFCVTDTQGNILYRIHQHTGDKLGPQHFQALEHLLGSAERIDRLYSLLSQWFIRNINASFGVWEGEQQDLTDFSALLDFLAKCYQEPTQLEKESLLLSH